MHNIGIFFLWALAAWILWQGSFAMHQSGYVCMIDDPNPKQCDNFCRTELLRMEAKLGESLLAVQEKIENQLQAVVNQLQALSNKIDAANVEVPASSTITIPPGFELIGNRYFRIVNEREDWYSAKRRCREMGGYLASFRNEEEFNAITPKLGDYVYWLGINDQEKEGHFESVASHKAALFLKWGKEEPNDKNHLDNYVYLYNGRMGENTSNAAWFFICQADNET
ncbi:C-type lectin 37Db-like [Drosophila kikkawai]|uniref:C-type lectin 37Db-like n=1 Tax=Drosophila kikkawai TaxID=30033 RepID=A0ABM4GA68_DROKI